MQPRLAQDSVFDAMADVFTSSTAVQVAELMTETGKQVDSSECTVG